MGTENWTGPLPVLSENLKTFADDMYDRQIINLAGKQYYPDSGVKYSLHNKHGAIILDVSVQNMRLISQYCAYLIEIGAVKDAKVEAS